MAREVRDAVHLTPNAARSAPHPASSSVSPRN